MMVLPSALLTLPNAGGRTVQRLQRKVRLLALRRFLQLEGVGLEERALHGLRQTQGRVQQMAKRYPQVVLAAVGAPDVLAPLLVLESGLRPEAEVIARLMPAMLMHLCGDGEALAEALVWEMPVSHLLDPRSGQQWRFAPAAKAMLADPVGVSVELQDGARLNLPEPDPHDHVSPDVGLLPLGAPPLQLFLSVHDANPISMDEAHPDKSGNAVSLGGRSLDEWQRRLNEAITLIQQTLPEWYGELSVGLDRIVPVGFEPEMHLSASYREAPGTVYMTLHPDPVTMAEAIIHETQHGKLNLLTWLDAVLHNGYSDWSPSPVRPDLRPLMGVLLAVHAFVPVAAFHARLAEQDHPLSRTRRFEERRLQVLSGNEGGLRILQDRAEPTAMGQKVLDGLVALHGLLAAGATALTPEALPPG